MKKLLVLSSFQFTRCVYPKSSDESSTIVVLQIDLFMQNEPNYKIGKINISSFVTS